MNEAKDKIQVTEEQAREILRSATLIQKIGDMDIWINNLKYAGYIKKSELKTFVEEAEDIYKKHIQYFSPGDVKDIMFKLYYTIQALKKTHPEFEK